MSMQKYIFYGIVLLIFLFFCNLLKNNYACAMILPLERLSLHPEISKNSIMVLCIKFIAIGLLLLAAATVVAFAYNLYRVLCESQFYGLRATNNLLAR